MSRIQERLLPFIPFVFVVLWSTGFIGAKFALPYIEPFYLLFVRALLTLCVFTALIFLLKSQWPNVKQSGHQIVAGSLVHAAYLGGTFAAIKWGMPAGITAIIVSLQPLLTVLINRVFFKQTLSLRQFFGLLMGLLGVTVILIGGEQVNLETLPTSAVAAALVALFGISVGTLYQKRFGSGVDLFSGSFYQYLATAAWMGLLAFSLETREIEVSLTLILALAWMVLGLSVSAILLLMLMIREGEAAKVASYFYLVPPLTVLEAWFLFNENLGVRELIGCVLTVVGVYLVLKIPAMQVSNRE